MRLLRWTLFGTLILTFGFVGLRCYETALQLETARLWSEEQRQDLARLHLENERLAAARPSAELREGRRSQFAEMQRLRTDLAAHLESRKRKAESPIPSQYVPRGLPADLPAGERAADQLRQAGTASPSAVAETLCWALNAGDRRSLGELVALSGDAAKKADELYAGLPPAQRAEFGTPERMIAAMLAAGTPIAKLEIFEEIGRADSPDWAMARVRVTYADGGKKESAVITLKTPEGWRWLVPPSVIARFAPTLQGKPPANPPGVWVDG